MNTLLLRLKAAFAAPLNAYRKHRTRHRIDALIAQAKTSTSTLPPRALTEQLLQQLHEVRIAHGWGQVIEVEMNKPNVEEYIAFLARTTALVQDDKLIPAQWIVENNSTHQLSLDRFLTSADGFYIDQTKAVMALREQALKLLAALAAADHEDTGPQAHNLRLLTKVLANLRTLALALHEVSKMK